MTASYDRRSFLSHSAATVGGIALTGTVVDGLVAQAASAATGVSTKTPKRGGTLRVALLSDVPNYHTFNGAQGKMDASGFCLANALYDPLFVMAADGKTVLPMLALSATPSANYTVWTVVLRQGVSFTNGDPFNASIVVANYQAAAADPTVGLAIQPIIASVTEVDTYTVKYTLVSPFSTFPITLTEQQITYMGHPSSFSSTYSGNPIGTGPFTVQSWSLNVESQWAKNPKYWRKDAAGRALPYLDALTFKIIPDAASRNQAIESGSVDMILQQTGTQIAQLMKTSGISVLTDIDAPRDPLLNCMIVNTTGTMNQYFCWAGEFAPTVPGALSYIKQGQAVPSAVQQADWLGTLGAVNPSTLQWDTTMKPVLNDVTIREACAMAINRAAYFKVIDDKIGAVADGLFRKGSPFYRNPGYPAYNPKRAKSLVTAYKKKHKVSRVSFVIDTISGDAASQQAFSFCQQQLAAVGIQVTSRPLVQSQLINNVIYGQYDCAQWNQFGGVSPSLNYVWFLSLSATASPTAGGLGLSGLPAGTRFAGAVNFAHQADGTVEANMLKALASPSGSAAERAAWQVVNTQFARVIPYLWLDTLVNAWAARSNVQNWAYATAANGKSRALNPDGDSSRWDQVWLS
jgi:ABC-type transport system substrate-binding protein